MAYKKRILSIILSLLIIVASIPAFSVNAHAAVAKTPTEYIFLGDSRTVGIANAVSGFGIKEQIGAQVNRGSGKNYYLARWGSKLDWAKANIGTIDKRVGANKAVIILMGCNDAVTNYPENITTQYANFFNSKAKEWTKKGARVYYVSVGYINNSYNTTQIKNFNTKLRNKLNREIIRWISIDDLSLSYRSDRVHYNTSTSKAIHKRAVDTANTDFRLASEARQTLANGVYEIHSAVNNKMVMDVTGASKNNGARVQLYQGNKTTAQKFKVQHLGGGYYKITCVASGKVLDVSGGSTKNGAILQQYTWNGSESQRWIIKAQSGGTYSILTAINGNVIDLPGARATNSNKLQMYQWNNTNAQKWKFVKVG